MTPAALRAPLAGEAAPPGLGHALQTLLWDAKGDWMRSGPRSPARWLSALALPLLLAACGRPPDPCADLGAHQALVGTLLFGGSVSDANWAAFLRDAVTPRFPDGLTAWNANGQWLDPDTGRVTAEASRVLLIVATPSTNAATGFADIAAAYKKRFHQKSVGIVTAPSCAAF